MREFFHGWRRKVGCVTLVMACVTFGGSMRSLCVDDTFVFGAGDGPVIRSITSCNNGITWAIYQCDEAAPFTKGWSSHLRSEVGYVDPFETVVREHEIEWRWKSLGFAFRRIRHISSEGDQLTCSTIPYWMLTLPLTLLSACLIVWKPRKRTGPEHA